MRNQNVTTYRIIPTMGRRQDRFTFAIQFTAGDTITEPRVRFDTAAKAIAYADAFVAEAR